MRPKAWSSRPPKGCRRTRGSIVVVPSFSIHLSLCSTGFHRLHCSYEEIRLLHGHRPVVVASFRSTARADPRRSPWVRTLDVPQPPLPLPPRPRLDFGHRVRCHGLPRASSPHRLAAPADCRLTTSLHCVQLPLARGCYQLAPRRTYTSNPVPMPGTPPVGLRPPFVTPAAAHSHPDCRGILTLIVAPDFFCLDGACCDQHRPNQAQPTADERCSFRCANNR